MVWMARVLADMKRLSLIQAFVDAQGLDRLHDWMAEALAKKMPQVLVGCLKVLATVPATSKTLGHKVAPVVKSLSRADNVHAREVRETALLVLRKWKSSYSAATGASSAPKKPVPLVKPQSSAAGPVSPKTTAHHQQANAGRAPAQPVKAVPLRAVPTAVTPPAKKVCR